MEYGQHPRKFLHGPFHPVSPPPEGPSPGISITESWRSARRTFRAWFVSLSTSRCVRLWRMSPACVSQGLSVRLLVDIWVVSQVHLSGTFLAKSSRGHVLSFLWTKHLGLEWLGHAVGVQYTPVFQGGVAPCPPAGAAESASSPTPPSVLGEWGWDARSGDTGPGHTSSAGLPLSLDLPSVDALPRVLGWTVSPSSERGHIWKEGLYRCT